MALLTVAATRRSTTSSSLSAPRSSRTPDSAARAVRSTGRMGAFCSAGTGRCSRSIRTVPATHDYLPRTVGLAAPGRRMDKSWKPAASSMVERTAGGAADAGVIDKINADGTGYQRLYDFPSESYNPYAGAPVPATRPPGSTAPAIPRCSSPETCSTESRATPGRTRCKSSRSIPTVPASPRFTRSTRRLAKIRPA
jgi:hypothetical protein